MVQELRLKERKLWSKLLIASFPYSLDKSISNSEELRDLFNEWYTVYKALVELELEK